jgi:hypothetical protein
MRPKTKGPYSSCEGDASENERPYSPREGDEPKNERGMSMSVCDVLENERAVFLTRGRCAQGREGCVSYAGETRPRARGPHSLRGGDAPKNGKDASNSEMGASMSLGRSTNAARGSLPKRGRRAQERDKCVHELGEIRKCRSWIARLGGGAAPESEMPVSLDWGRHAQERDGRVKDAGEMRPRAR